jgi:hypothetical protein
VLPSPGGSTSGCEPSDFPAETSGAVSLIQRGTCAFTLKLQNAVEARAIGVILFNEGDTAGGSNALFRSADPVEKLYPNVVAETRRGDANHTILVGAHLDSVEDGPGVNDDGSGSATILEIAEAMHKTKPRNAVRFVWFSAEEAGLLGSAFYVSQLSDAQRADIAAMLDFDMLASPSFARFLYDGDLSSFPGPVGGVPEASGQIEKIFTDYFAAHGMATLPTAFDGRSDYRDFIRAGIPAGGIFAGAEVVKTPAQAAIFGGAAGEQFDPCSDAAAHAVITLAQSTEMLNGERGKGNFNSDAKIQDQAAR